MYRFTITGTVEYLQPQKLEISVYGNKRIISFNESSVNDVSNSKNVIGIATSNLLQENTKLGEVKMSTIITDNITNDYSTGISNGKITIGCADYYDINGNKVKTWANGDILEVGDIIRIDKDNLGNSISKYADGTIRYWQITGRKFRNTGVPMIDLEYMETKSIYFPPPLPENYTINITNNSGGAATIIQDETTYPSDCILTVEIGNSITFTGVGGSLFWDVYINGINMGDSNGYVYTPNGNATIIISAGSFFGTIIITEE